MLTWGRQRAARGTCCAGRHCGCALRPPQQERRPRLRRASWLRLARAACGARLVRALRAAWRWWRGRSRGGGRRGGPRRRRFQQHGRLGRSGVGSVEQRAAAKHSITPARHAEQAYASTEAGSRRPRRTRQLPAGPRRQHSSGKGRLSLRLRPNRAASEPGARRRPSDQHAAYRREPLPACVGTGGTCAYLFVWAWALTGAWVSVEAGTNEVWAL